MAQRADGETDKSLWLTLAQSWVRLAEHVARVPSLVDGDSEQTRESMPAGADG